jgi:hypothetical protein
MFVKVCWHNSEKLSNGVANIKVKNQFGSQWSRKLHSTKVKKYRKDFYMLLFSIYVFSRLEKVIKADFFITQALRYI